MQNHFLFVLFVILIRVTHYNALVTCLPRDIFVSEKLSSSIGMKLHIRRLYAITNHRVNVDCPSVIPVFILTASLIHLTAYPPYARYIVIFTRSLQTNFITAPRVKLELYYTLNGVSLECNCAS